VSVFMTLDERARVREHRFERTVVRSRHRLSYEQAQAALDGTVPIGEPTDDALRALARLGRVLAERRSTRGALDFDLPEARVVLGDDGAPVRIERVERLETHRLIESFMLLANEVVAHECARRRLPILYRVHDPPPPDQMRELRQFLASYGLKVKGRGSIPPGELQRVLEAVRGTPKEALVTKVVLRSMARARYDARNLGHYGLAAEWYCHFTSPIRRYPDLWTHRVVVRSLIEGEPPLDRWEADERRMVAAHCSRRERAADDAERESVAMKKVEYMERHLGETLSGVISDVRSFGFFVLLDDAFVEGLVHVNQLHDDYYVYQDRNHTLVGERTRRRFRLGDRVRVTVARVDRQERRIDFVLAD
ncbi:MAG: RNB domain-containing ribonuclease, partial [Gemmatimonadetes bacterium]